MARSFTPEYLRSLKRNQLQKVAMQNGIKANQTSDVIIAKLLEKSVTEKSDESIPKEEGEDDKIIKEDDIMPSPESYPDIMTARPPWEASNIDLDSPTVDEENRNREPKSDPLSDEKTVVKRTRSSSRSRTPKSTVNPAKTQARKTFSVERKTTKARTVQSTGTDLKTRGTKRKSEYDSVSHSTSEAKKSKNDNVDETLKTGAIKATKQSKASSNRRNSKTSASNESRIPRFAASGVTVGPSKTNTPGKKDWSKHHARRFNKMESIDDYEERKKERARKLLGSQQKNKAALTRLAQPSRRGSAKVTKPIRPLPVPNLTSPAPRSKAKTPHSIMKTRGETPGRGPTFKPTVMSTSKMDLNFGKKLSKMQTPKRVTIVSDQNVAKQKFVKTPATGMRSKSVMGTPVEKRKSLSATPKAADTTLTPGGSRKSAFDLKESLKKPLSWVPHRGPLKPYNDTTKKPSFQDRMAGLKNPKVSSRESRRQKMADAKKQAKDSRMLQRRGIK